MRCIVESSDGMYLTARRPTGRMYQSRSGWSDDLQDAKVFGNKGGATSAANQCDDQRDYTVKEVEIKIIA